MTHDRRFLDRVATRIVELDRGRLAAFRGGFSRLPAAKEELLAAETVQNEKFDKVLAQEEVWIRKGIEARRTRNEGRVRRLEQLRRERAARRERIGSVKLELAEGERTGQLVAELEHVEKAFGERTIVRDFSTRILRGDKVGHRRAERSGQDDAASNLILGELPPTAARFASAPAWRSRISTSCARSSTMRRC